jgi:glycerate 2-kinase
MVASISQQPIPDARARPREFLEHLYRVAVERALPLASMGAHLPPPPKGRTLVLGAGKAGGSMAQALEALWPADAPLSGLVVTRYGHVPPRPEGLPQRIEIVEASHPVPDEAGMQAAQRILALTQDLTVDDLVLCLISGGGSSVLTLPADGMTLADKQRISQQLLDSGAGIGEMNCVRKHLSRVKGGRLAAACAPAKVVTLTISDVPGDDPAVIASGPTVPDATTCADALAILDRYRIAVPAAVRADLESGALETPKPGDQVFGGHVTHLIATPQQSLEAAAAVARAAGLEAHILSDEIEGESREVGKVHAALARSVAQRGAPFAKPCVILSGGETTVTIRPRPPGQAKGRGGRAGEFCMGLAGALMAQPGVWALAADTDGIDGVEDNAGAFVTPDTLARALAQGRKLSQHMDRNDAYGYFDAIGDLLVTGPTHTNINDFRALLIL